MRPSEKAWIALGLGVVIWDVFGPEGETLSEAFDGWISTPLGRVLAVVGTALVVAHLHNMVDSRYDPISWLFGLFRLAGRLVS